MIGALVLGFIAGYLVCLLSSHEKVSKLVQQAALEMGEQRSSIVRQFRGCAVVQDRMRDLWQQELWRREQLHAMERWAVCYIAYCSERWADVKAGRVATAVPIRMARAVSR